MVAEASIVAAAAVMAEATAIMVAPPSSFAPVRVAGGMATRAFAVGDPGATAFTSDRLESLGVPGNRRAFSTALSDGRERPAPGRITWKTAERGPPRADGTL